MNVLARGCGLRPEKIAEKRENKPGISVEWGKKKKKTLEPKIRPGVSSHYAYQGRKGESLLVEKHVIARTGQSYGGNLLE